MSMMMTMTTMMEMNIGKKDLLKIKFMNKFRQFYKIWRMNENFKSIE